MKRILVVLSGLLFLTTLAWAGPITPAQFRKSNPARSYETKKSGVALYPARREVIYVDRKAGLEISAYFLTKTMVLDAIQQNIDEYFITDTSQIQTLIDELAPVTPKDNELLVWVYLKHRDGESKYHEQILNDFGDKFFFKAGFRKPVKRIRGREEEVIGERESEVFFKGNLLESMKYDVFTKTYRWKFSFAISDEMLSQHGKIIIEDPYSLVYSNPHLFIDHRLSDYLKRWIVADFVFPEGSYLEYYQEKVLKRARKRYRKQEDIERFERS